MEPIMEPCSYDPFSPGPFVVRTESLEARDEACERVFSCDVWRPDQAGDWPLIVFSHHSGGSRRAASFLTTHLASHGYVVGALDHSEVVAPEIAGKVDEIIASRVPDVLFLIGRLLETSADDSSAAEAKRIGIVGHSFGGWTALAVPETGERIGALVALAPAGASNPKPGIIPATLSFNWRRPPATLYLIAEDDVFLPIAGMYELYERTPGEKQMVILRRADHLHFADNVEERHEQARAMTFPPAAAWIPREMRPIGELCSGGEARRFIRGLTLAHLDATLKGNPEARRLLDKDLARTLAANAIDGYEHGAVRIGSRV
jgi:dienelactone hydrolase